MMPKMPTLKPKTEKVTTVKVNQFTFSIGAYCYQKVGMTENMKFRVKCKENTLLDREFDDLKEVLDYINEFIYMDIIDLLI